MIESEAWVDDLSTQPLPGGVSALATPTVQGAAGGRQVRKPNPERIPPGTRKGSARLAVVQARDHALSRLLALAVVDTEAFRGRPHDRRLPLTFLGAAGCWCLRARARHQSQWPANGRELLETGMRVGFVTPTRNASQGWSVMVRSLAMGRTGRE